MLSVCGKGGEVTLTGEKREIDKWRGNRMVGRREGIGKSEKERYGRLASERLSVSGRKEERGAGKRVGK